ncbi:MAG: APC family permease [Deltaproteobacteria bacterium]|nr:APC family permease [Deltaproteobacteria bacterium]
MSPFLIILNLLLIGGAVFLYFRPKLLVYFRGGKLYLTWLAIGVITLMDELTSVFYAPAEAFHYIGLFALFFLPFTSLFIRYLTTRLVEIAEILDVHDLKGGGVYNFSYLVLGPLISFVAVSSIMVDYVLTAAISSVSAVENLFGLVGIGPHQKLIVELLMIWGVAGLNIIGIRANARTTFAIFLGTGLVLINLLVMGAFQVTPQGVATVVQSFHLTFDRFRDGNFLNHYTFLVASISGCILAYSGVESVMQTAALARNWKTIKQSYLFLGLTVGIFTPLVSLLTLSDPRIDLHAHQTDLITHYASLVGGQWFSVLIALTAGVTLLMAVNTAFVASSELIERVAHRYGFHSVIKTNRHASLYRIHIANAVFYSLVIYFTQGSQGTLAGMYAVGLVATFVINLGSLLIYRYSKGTKKLRLYNVSRIGTLLLFVIVLSIFIYLSYHKPPGFFLWLGVTVVSLVAGIYGTRKRAPELTEIEKGETPMDIILFLGESNQKNVHIYFKRPFDSPQDKTYDTTAFITFYTPRQKIPPRVSANHFRIPFKRASIYHNIVAILDLLVYEAPHFNLTVHFGWPTSSWYDRLSIGVMMFQLMRLPRLFPAVNFRIDKFKSTSAPA